MHTSSKSDCSHVKSLCSSAPRKPNNLQLYQKTTYMQKNIERTLVQEASLKYIHKSLFIQGGKKTIRRDVHGFSCSHEGTLFPFT